jgi:GAF domain-containing protein
MQTSLQNMEHQVDEQSQDLERRTSQLQAAAEIGRAVSTIHNINDLLERSSTLISNRFNFYHAGIFLVDETGRFAVLRAANSEGGKRMLARSHRLAVGQQGIVGYVTSTGRPRIALDVGADAIFFNNPDLPQTRSELALPLISGDRILGALDVQSDQPGAFTNEDVTVLQVLADFLAVAIENARLFLESQTALESIRHAYGELSERSWVDRLENVSGIGFRSLDQGVFSLGAEPLASGPTEGQKLSIPIRVRETLIGYVDAYKSSTRGEWTKEELDTMDALVDQLGVALESARLFENTQLLAERERLVGDFNTHLQESLDVDTVLRTAVLEMRQMLGTKYVTLVLGKGNES